MAAVTTHPHHRGPGSPYRVTVLIVLGIAALLAAAMAAAIAYRHGMFSQGERLYFVTNAAQGMSAGTTVRLAGVRVGTITDVDLLPDASVRVTLGVDPQARKLLRADAAADLIREQLQPAAIELRPGTADAPLPANDPRLQFSRRPTITEVAADLNRRLGPILDDVKLLTASVAARRGDIETVIAQGGAAARDLAATAQSLRAVADDARTIVATAGGQVKQALAEANRTVSEARRAMVAAQGTVSEAGRTAARVGDVAGRAGEGLTMITANLPAMLRKLDATLEGVNRIVADGRSVSAAAAASLPPALGNVPPLVEDARQVAGAVKGIWPLSSRVPPPHSDVLTLDSHDASAAAPLER